MADEEETLMDTISAAVEEQRGKPAPEPEAPAPEPPAEPPKEQALEESSPTRDASGRFRPKAPPTVETKPEQELVDKSEAEEPARPDITRPPKRLPVSVKGAWVSLPEPVREGLIAREQEFDKAFKSYDGLGQYAREAEKNGTTLQNAVRDYAELETVCRRDPVAGVDALAQKLGWNQRALAYAMAVKHGFVAPQQGQQPQQQAPQTAPTKAELMSELRAERENERVHEQIESFAADPKNIYFENVRPDMARLVNAGLANNLKDAYDKACQLHPEIARLNGSAADRSGQADKTAAANRARLAAKAIGGAPSQGSNASAKTPDDGNLSVFDTVRAAVARQRG